MEAVILVIHLIVALAIIIVVMLQRSEGGGLGIGGGGMGSFAGQRSTTDFMTKLTTVLGGIFVMTSLSLAILATQKTEDVKGSILDIKQKDSAAIQSVLDKETVKKDTMNNVENAPVDGGMDIPAVPAKIITDKTTEKPTAPISK